MTFPCWSDEKELGGHDELPLLEALSVTIVLADDAQYIQQKVRRQEIPQTMGRGCRCEACVTKCPTNTNKLCYGA